MFTGSVPKSFREAILKGRFRFALPPGCRAERARVQLHSAFSWDSQPLSFSNPAKKHVQLYLRLPHCIIPNIFIPSGTEHLHTPSLQEASSHARETASCWASGPRVSAPANATDISVYVMPLVGGSPSPVCSHRPVATAAGLPLPISLCHTTTKFVPSQRAGGTIIPLQDIHRRTLPNSRFASIKGKDWKITLLCISSQGKFIFASFSWEDVDAARINTANVYCATKPKTPFFSQHFHVFKVISREKTLLPSHSYLSDCSQICKSRWFLLLCSKKNDYCFWLSSEDFVMSDFAGGSSPSRQVMVSHSKNS